MRHLIASRDFREGFVDMLPACVGLVPFGVVCGVGAAAAGADWIAALGMALIIFSGAAQILAVQLYAANAPVAIIVLTCFVLGLRFLMYSAAIQSAPAAAAPTPHTTPNGTRPTQAGSISTKPSRNSFVATRWRMVGRGRGRVRNGEGRRRRPSGRVILREARARAGAGGRACHERDSRGQDVSPPGRAPGRPPMPPGACRSTRSPRRSATRSADILSAIPPTYRTP